MVITREQQQQHCVDSETRIIFCFDLIYPRHVPRSLPGGSFCPVPQKDAHEPCPRLQQEFPACETTLACLLNGPWGMLM